MQLKEAGYGHVLNEDKTRKKGLFCLSKQWIRNILDLRGWRSKGSYGDARKTPANSTQLGVDMVDRLACMILEYEILEDLVLNGDHTSAAITPNAGKTGSMKTLKTDEMIAANDTSVQQANDKRNTTVLVCSDAKGGMVASQWVVEGKTVASLPNSSKCAAISGYSQTRSGVNSKQRTAAAKAEERAEKAHAKDPSKPIRGPMPRQPTLCFTPVPCAAVPGLAKLVLFVLPQITGLMTSPPMQQWMMCMCHTSRRKFRHFTKRGSASPSFGEQCAVLVCDVWYGWLDADFHAHVRSKYPWLLLLFVPPFCTHLFQPADCGIIRAFKAALLRLYEEWAMAQVLEQLK